MNDKFFEIFRAGNYSQGNITVDDLDEIVKNYDPSFQESPIAIFHEKESDGFAYGWIKSLKREGNKLMGSFKDVSDELKKLIAEKKLRGHSVSIYRDLAGRGKYLKELAMLGVQAPAVKGMPAIEFAEGESEEYKFTDDPTLILDLVTSYYQDFSEKLKQEKEEAETKLADEEKKVLSFQESTKSLEFKQRETDFISFLDQKSEEGSLPPVLRDDAVALFKELDPIQEGSGDSKPVDTLKNFLSKLKPLISFEETPDGDTEEVDIPTGEEIRNYVEEQRKVGKQLSFSEAQFLLTQKKKRN